MQATHVAHKLRISVNLQVLTNVLRLLQAMMNVQRMCSCGVGVILFGDVVAVFLWMHLQYTGGGASILSNSGSRTTLMTTAGAARTGVSRPSSAGSDTRATQRL